MRRWRHLGQRFGRTGRGGVKVGAYLLRDEFTTDLSAGSVDGTPAEPGPGVRTVADTNSKLALSSGNLVIATGGFAPGDPGLWYPAQTRRPGRMVVAGMVFSSNAAAAIGFDADQSSFITTRLQFAVTGNLAITAGGTTVTVAAYATTTYPVAVILRTNGAFYFWKVSGAWLLAWYDTIDSDATVYPAVNANSTSAAFSCQYMRVPAERWLPRPLLSDGFSDFSASDGLGHAEGISGGIGSGGQGVEWSNAVGTWSVGGTPATSAAESLSGGLAVRTSDVGKADLIVSCEITRTGGTAGIVVRWLDANNHIQLRHTGTNVQLVKVVDGSSTTLVDAAATYVDGAPLRLICDGPKFRAFYNNAAYGGEQTINDAALQAPTVVGLRTSDLANKFDNFVAYARGTAGEYAALDAF